MTITFASLGVPDEIVGDLARRGITEPFPIQAATLPDGLAGRDLCGKAPTGSGKTIAFGIPMICRVKRAAPKRPKGLVLAPTRELALQVADELRAMSGDLRVLAVYGGAGLEPQIKQLRQGVDIVVACPGRLLDLIDRKSCDLRDVSFAVLDEADRMADMGFLPDVRRILDQTNPVRQTVLFSATLDGAVDQLVKEYQHDPAIHEMPDEKGGDIAHHFWMAERPERVDLLARVVDRTGPTIVFCRTKHGSDRVARQLAKAGVKAAAIHGNRSQAQRERALTAFHRGDVAALVATDVAARGIHVEGVTCVVHYDIPADPKDYIHRSGRTGRAGADGVVVAFVDKAQRKDAVKLKKGAGEGDVELTDPDVDSLPEGAQQRFRPERGRGAAPKADQASSTRPATSRTSPAPQPSLSQDRTAVASNRAPVSPSRVPAASTPTSSEPAASSEPGHRDDRSRSSGDRSERTSREGSWSAESASPSRGEPQRRRGVASVDRGRAEEVSPRDGRPARPARHDRTARPAEGDRERRAAQARSHNEPPSGENRTTRRQTQFTAGERAAKAAANEGRELRRSSGEGGARLPSDVVGGHKVRASGASRRKAKREALVASGEPAPPAKKRRSGKPRPPASARGRS